VTQSKGRAGHWKKAADHLQRFVNEEVIYETGNFVQSHDLYARYRSWCASHGEEPLTDKKLKLPLKRST
jgi:phage/plasmid-associated DNA primase